MKKPSAVFAYLVFEMMWIIHRVIIAGMISIHTSSSHCYSGEMAKYCTYDTVFYVTGAAYMIESGKKLD